MNANISLNFTNSTLTAADGKIGKVNLNALFNAQALFCFYYMALGSYMPFINLYYERLGLSGVQIGTLAALPVLITATITFGLASVSGTLIGGYLYHNAGMQNFFRIFSLLGVAGLAIFLMASKHKLISGGVGEK